MEQAEKVEQSYLFWVSNTTNFAPETQLFGISSNKFSRDIVIGVPPNYLPVGKKDPKIVVIHREHANLSTAMVFDPKDGTFICRHCLKKISISDDTFNKILKEISAGHTGLIGTSEPTGMEIVLSTILDELPKVDGSKGSPLAGYYLAKVKSE